MTDLEQVAASHGFTAVKSEPISEVEGTVHLMHHAASGARLMFIENDDANKAFSITFKTPADDDTGVFHILEHSVLCGSEKFPVKEPFVNLLKTSMQTFLNAMTFPDKTMYPVASTNEQDLVNLMDVYLDAVFHPDIYRRPVIFQQEGWHRELEGEGEGERLVVNGVVYNEMKGALSEPDSVLYDGLSAALFPDTTYRFESGGTPAAIPTLTYEGFLENHRRHYRPDNAYIILYGNLDADRFLGFLDERYLAPLAAKERGPLDINPLGLQAPVAPEPVVVPMATAPENACAAVGFVIGRAAERERIVAADILMDAIMGANESPLKRALLDAGIAD
ncbi:insulinase family protein, partial [Adlercreutzia sp.]